MRGQSGHDVDREIDTAISDDGIGTIVGYGRTGEIVRKLTESH